jgi:hypothetical protein
VDLCWPTSAFAPALADPTTIAAVTALALGIGVNTAIFSLVDAVLLKPVPFPEPDRLVMFMNTSPQGQGAGASPAKFAKWRKETSVIQDAAAMRTGVMNLTTGDKPEQLRSGQVSADFFKLVGAPIVQGRPFSGGFSARSARRVDQRRSLDAKFRQGSFDRRQAHLAGW